ncbi:hypothetical protein N2152v2_008612 [Parachlorella kessleri]
MSASGRAGAVKETLGTEAYENLAGKQVKRDVLPALREKGVKVYFISIGKPERGSEFVERTGFPADHLLADPDTVTYEALPFKKGVLTTLFNPKTPLSIWSRIKSGDVKDLGNMAKKFVKNKLWHPPKQDQAYQQGGVVIFEGKELLWAHYDPATGAHADLKEVVEVATDGL